MYGGIGTLPSPPKRKRGSHTPSTRSWTRTATEISRTAPSWWGEIPRAPSIRTVDASASRRLQLGPRWNALVRVEAFNVFNQTNLGFPVRILESPGFGIPFDTRIDPRSVRFSARLSF